MHQRLNELLEQETCFYSLQFGFYLNSSTNNVLMSTIKDIQTCCRGFWWLEKSFWYNWPWYAHWKTGSWWFRRVAKDRFIMLPGVEETTFSNWKWNINNEINIEDIKHSTLQMIQTLCIQINIKRIWGFQSLGEHLVGFEQGAFRSWM